MGQQSDISSVPTELLARPQWIGWKNTFDSNRGAYTKRPHNPHSGRLAASDNSETWGSVQDALDAIPTYDLTGVGFVFTADDPYCGIDFDHCITDGVIEPWAAEIIRQLNSYSEVSPSGQGVHVIVKGAIPAGRRAGQIEVYSSGRYFTMTGRRVPDTPEDIRDAQPELDALLARLDAGAGKKEGKPAPIPVATGLGDDQILQLAREAANGDKFTRLWDGDIGAHDSASEADLALCSMLAFWTGKDAGSIDRLFRQSGLYRDKWDKVHSRKAGGASTYGQMTIDKAIELTTEVFEPSRAGTIIHQGIVIGDLPAEFFQTAQRIPELPESARISPESALYSSPWLDSYIEFSRQESPAGWDGYHEACGIWLLSTLASRRIATQPTLTVTLYPNLFLALAGVSTLWRKSTTANVARFVLQRLGVGEMVYPHVSSSENLIRIMRPPLFIDGWNRMSDEERQEQENAARWANTKGLYWDELGVRLLSILNRRGAYSGLYQLLLQAGRGDPIGQHTIERGLEAAPDAYVTLLGSLTPANLKRGVGGEDSQLWSDGFFGRFNFVCPPLEAKPTIARWRHTEHIPNDVLQPLAEWHTRLPQPVVDIREDIDEDGEGMGRFRCEILRPAVQLLKVSDTAEDAFYAYTDALQTVVWEQSQNGNFVLAPSYQSLPMTALRIAMLLASVDGHSRIELNHWARAQQITERWRESLHNLLEQVEEPAPDPMAAKLDKVFRIIQDEWRKTENQRVSVGYINRRLRTLPKTEILDLLTHLQIRRMVRLEHDKAENGRDVLVITPYSDGEDD